MMEMNNDPEWLKRMSELEPGGFMACSPELYAQMNDDALCRDAERYRFLKTHAVRPRDVLMSGQRNFLMSVLNWPFRGTARTFDEWVDAAMQRVAERKSGEQ